MLEFGTVKRLIIPMIVFDLDVKLISPFLKGMFALKGVASVKGDLVVHEDEMTSVINHECTTVVLFLRRFFALSMG